MSIIPPQAGDSVKVTIAPGVGTGTPIPVGGGILHGAPADIPSLVDGLTTEQLTQLFKAFGDYTPAIGAGFKTTQDYLLDELNSNSRPNTVPSAVNPWECRIGGSKFIVPPVNIDVAKTFVTGSLTGAAIRQMSSPKFNSGHSSTTITMSLYFPSDYTIWGYQGDTLYIDFDTTSDAVIDPFMGSLRGLITQFKYTPFLPVKNQYLNSVWNVSAVAMQGLTIQTVESFPDCLMAQLTMLAFNHKVFLPMVDQLEDAVHWGRFRQYVGRAAVSMEEAANKDFLLLNTDKQFAVSPTDPSLNTAQQLDSPNQSVVTYSKSDEAAGGFGVQLFFPDHDPAQYLIPTGTVFQNQDPQNSGSTQWWNTITSLIGLNLNTYGGFADVVNYPNAPYLLSEFGALKEFLKLNQLTVQMMNSAQRDAYVAARLKAAHITDSSSQAAKDWATRSANAAWYGTIYTSFLTDPKLQAIFKLQEYLRGSVQIEEWQVPMRKLNINPANVIVQQVSVSMGNNLARLQLNMIDEPTYQHIGGLDTTIVLTLKVMGEADLTGIRNMFDIINGLSRLEHAHAVLGFLGIKNLITALCGTKYIVPKSFDVQTSPDFPHVYDVNLTFVDFDIFQQKRELLSSEQQSEFIVAFGKKNPFLRIKQLWGAFNAYPDFPLSIRDGAGKITGHLDPDYYFNAYVGIDDDIVEGYSVPAPPGGKPDPSTSSALNSDYAVIHHLGPMSDDGTHQSIGINPDGTFDLRSSDNIISGGVSMSEPHTGNTHFETIIGAGTASQPEVAAPANTTVLPNFDTSGTSNNSGDPNANFGLMMKDTAYRDKTGRMVRAFPTYMLWLIDEGGTFAGVKLFDNFYGLQSVIDFSVFSSEDVMGDVLTLRISNLYSRLSTAYADLIDPNLFPDVANILNIPINQNRNFASGLDPQFLVSLQTVNLQPGVRLHLRMGYSANPNKLETVFNGTITQVEQGDIMTVTAQSDAIELGAIVNNTTKSGDSGHIDGSLMSGFWLSEPRDLMVRLLSMGTSTFSEVAAHATRGTIYSQNKYGIRHFGSMLYDPMTTHEKKINSQLKSLLNSKALTYNSFIASGAPGAPAGLISGPIASLAAQLWANFNTKRDYEIFKRNIYPGNGTGICQYQGASLGDGGIANAFTPPGVANNGIPFTSGQNPIDQLKTAARIQNGQLQAPANSTDHFKQLVTKLSNAARATGTLTNILHDTTAHNIFKIVGIENEVTDDVPGGFYGPFAEVSFRAETYLKTVWDLFQVCAALCPNYIVAVRPFEDRSTVFYGKPHWAYTSGVLPLSSGINQDNGPTLSNPDSAGTQKILDQIEVELAKRDSLDKTTNLYNQLSGVTSDTWNTLSGAANGAVGGDPNASSGGTVFSGGDVTQLPQTAANGAKIPVQKGVISMEMHLPTSKDLATDVAQHLQSSVLDPANRHPFYMDRVGGGVGGYVGTNPFTPGGTVVKGDNPNAPGNGTAFTPNMTPAEEQYYVAMRWPTGAGYPNLLQHRRILIYCERTKMGCICTPGDWGPGTGIGRVGGVSPDAYYALGKPINTENTGDQCWFGFVDDTIALGPVDFTASNINPLTGISTIPKPPSSSTPAAPPVSSTTGSVSTTPTPPSSSIDVPGSTTNPSGNLPPFTNTTTGTATGPSTGTATGTTAAPPPTDKSSIKEADSLKTGWQPKSSFPVDFSDSSGLVDKIGDGARQVFDSFRSLDVANHIWDEFRQFFGSDKETRKVFDQNYKGTDAQFNTVASMFVQWMWQNAYNRGWIVSTADTTFDPNPVESTLNDLAHVAGDITGVDVQGNPITSTALKIVGFLTGSGGPGAKKTRAYSFSRARSLFGIYITQGPGAPNSAGSVNSTNDPTGGGAIQWMLAHGQAGKSYTSIIGRAAEEVKNDVWNNLYKIYKDTTKVIGDVLTGVVNLYRISQMLLNNGLNMSGFSGKQSNLLNFIFNDSHYYDPALGIGSLLWLADNAFTREYGEPVVEIRQPFQRLHYINSFSHILANGIIENMDDVATIVTATSNGNGSHPKTVYFDKGAPTERQVEKNVDTGLFWDKPSGFLGGIFHPMTILRDFAKHWNHSDDATEANCVARYWLKENLKNIYSGEIVIVGDPDMRPYDLVYIADSYEKIFGMFEIEQVIHHFTPELGFVTSITPNAIVIVNDPHRWQFGSMLQRQWAVQTLRNSLRHQLGVSAKRASVGGQKQSIDSKEIVSQANTELLGSVQFTGGLSALVKDLGGMGGVGGIALQGVSTAIPGVGFLAWKAFDWVRDNILDAHGCYIQYLNRNGSPMDAGLSYNHGVAVGQMHVWSGLSAALNIQIPVSIDGSPRIQTDDLLKNLGWDQTTITQTVEKDINWWMENTKTRILGLSQRNQESPPMVTPAVQLGRVVEVLDGNTILVSLLDIGGFGSGNIRVKLGHIVDANTAASSQTVQLPPGTGFLQANPVAYMNNVLFANPGGFVALRGNPDALTDPADPGLYIATVFFRVLDGITDVASALLQNAASFPAITWDAYMSNGFPYSLNWELVAKGLAHVDTGPISSTIPGQGVIGSGSPSGLP